MCVYAIVTCLYGGPFEEAGKCPELQLLKTLKLPAMDAELLDREALPPCLPPAPGRDYFHCSELGDKTLLLKTLHSLRKEIEASSGLKVYPHIDTWL